MRLKLKRGKSASSATNEIMARPPTSRATLPCLGALLLMAAIMSATAAAPFRRVLLNANDGVSIPSVQITPKDVREAAGKWSVRNAKLVGGKQDGVDLITVDNGKLRFAVIPTRGMSVLKVEMGAVRLGWDSPVK